MAVLRLMREIERLSRRHSSASALAAARKGADAERSPMVHLSHTCQVVVLAKTLLTAPSPVWPRQTRVHETR